MVVMNSVLTLASTFPAPIPYPVYTSLFELMRRSRSPLAPLKNGGIGLLVPLLKGDLGGSLGFSLLSRLVYAP